MEALLSSCLEQLLSSATKLRDQINNIPLSNFLSVQVLP
jgi:hypothetical protein